MTSQLLSRLIPDDPEDAPRAEATGPVLRLRLLLVTLSLALLVFAQNAGTTAADTKIDLVVSPWRFLSRALRLWDPIGGAGQLQNQAYGYLFPMGPFFGVLHGLNVPPWEIQRSWQTALVVAAFLGGYRLSRHFGCAGFWPRVAAGLCYALAPRMLSELSTISSELLPVAALPWILLPLVTGARTGRPRRSAARSGIGLLFAGGINAAASLAVLPVPALWLLTRSRGPRRAALIRWWLLMLVLASLWWLLPLLVLGKYSPPFLNWIESASTTTLPTSLSASLRGVDHWESYLGSSVWPGAWILASAPAAILATAAVAGIGLAGLAGRNQPHRDFLWASLLLGLVLVTLGHLAPVGPPFAGQLQQLLDGPLVAFRNLHKFDPLIRLPLALGFGAFLQRMRLPLWWRVPVGRLPIGRLLVPARAVGLLAVCAIGAVAISPVLTNQSVASPRVTTEPGWWVETGQWLAGHADGSRALLVPASTSPVYLWGGTVDTALQPVASTPWTVRDAVPLAQAGYVRLLDSITTMLAAGRPDPSLAALLNRSGIGYLVVANDLNGYRSGATPLMLLHATIDDAPGFTRLASFGPDVGSAGNGPNKLLDGGASVVRPSVQIYRVRAPGTAAAGPGRSPLVSLTPLSQAVLANGSSDQLGPLVRAGLAADRPVLFGADADQAKLPTDQGVLTDGIRKRQASFGNAFATSATMTAGQAYTGHRAAYDYLPAEPGPLSVMSYRGISTITASSSGSDIGAYVNRSQANSPFAAVDGNPDTAWHSGSPSGAVGQWLQVGFDQPISASTVAIQFVAAGRFTPNRVTVRTDQGSILQPVSPDDSVQLLRLPNGPTRTLRITVASVEAGGYGTSVGISELNVPGVQPARLLSVPAAPAPGQLLFSAAPGQRSSCLARQGRPVCDASYGVGGEEDGGIDRAIELTSAGDYRFQPTVVLQPSPTLASALAAGSGIRVTTSSTLAGDPGLLASSLIDHDPATSWQAARGDREPKITLTLPKPRVLTGLRLSTDPLAAAASPLTVSVAAGNQHWQGNLPADGAIRFASPVRTDQVTVTITVASIRQSLSSVSFANSLLPVGISELTLTGPGQPLPAPSEQVRIGCAAGLALTVDGTRLPLSVTASRAEVLAGRPVLARPCSPLPVTLTAGPHTIELASTPVARAAAIRASSDELPAGLGLSAGPTGLSAPQVLSWQATARAIQVPAGPAGILQIRENQNPGWQASLNGHRLTAIRVDGWQQGFLVPAGASGVVRLSFAPQHPFELGLAIGVLAVLALLLLAVLGVRRRTAEQPAALADGVLPGWLRLLVLAVAMMLLAGLWGLAAMLALMLFCEVVVATGRRISPWVLPVVMLMPALLETQASAFTLFATANSAESQLLCVSAIVLGVIGPGWRAESRRQGTVA